MRLSFQSNTSRTKNAIICCLLMVDIFARVTSSYIIEIGLLLFYETSRHAHKKSLFNWIYNAFVYSIRLTLNMTIRIFTYFLQRFFLLVVILIHFYRFVDHFSYIYKRYWNGILTWAIVASIIFGGNTFLWRKTNGNDYINSVVRLTAKIVEALERLWSTFITKRFHNQSSF